VSLLTSLIDLIYPPRCLICREFLVADAVDMENRSLSFCETCFGDFRETPSPLCPSCGRPFTDGVQIDHWCEDCLRKQPHYEAAGAPYLYEGAVMNAIHVFKYGAESHAAESLGPLLAAFTQQWLPAQSDLLLLPVPLHPKRLRERGFNQSLLLARHVAGHVDAALDFLTLRRVKYTQPQTGLGKEERRKNVRRAFEVVEPKAVKGKTVLLVDDVATTGNTLNECARVLKRAGSKKVYCVVLARAAFP
jgi:ComF family protein